MLVRTFTEARRLSLARTVAGLSRTTSGTRAVLADRYNELAQLKQELLAHPVAAATPAHLRRTCAVGLCSNALVLKIDFNFQIDRHMHEIIRWVPIEE